MAGLRGGVIAGLLALLCPAGLCASSKPLPELTVAMGHTGMVKGLAASPDGRLFATGSDDHTAKLWDLETGRELKTFRGHSQWVRGVAFTQDSAMLLTASADTVARLWDVASGALLQEYGGSMFGPYLGSAAVLSPDGRLIAAGSSTPLLLDRASGKTVREFPKTEKWINAYSFSGDGKRLAGAGDDGKVYLWDAAAGTLVRAFEGHRQAVNSVAFSPDGRAIVSGGADFTVRRWDPATGEGRVLWDSGRDYGGQRLGQQVEQVAFSPDGLRVAVATGYGHKLKLIDADTGAEVWSADDPSFVQGAAFCPGGGCAASGSYDNRATLYDAASGKELRTFKGRGQETRDVAVSPDGRLLVLQRGNGQTSVWDLAAGREVRRVKGEDWRTSGAFSRDTGLIATNSGSLANDVVLWDLATGAAARRIPLGGVLSGVAFLRDGKNLLAGIFGGAGKVFDGSTGALVRELPALGEFGSWSGMDLSPDGKSVFVPSSTTVRMFDLDTGAETRVFSGAGEMVWSAAASPDGRRLAAVHSNGALMVWDTATGQAAWSGRAAADGYGVVAFSPDSRLLVTQAYGNQALVWDAATGREAGSLAGHSAAVTSAVFLPGGRLAVTSSKDGTARVWDMTSFKEVCRLISLDEGWVVVSPDGLFDGSPEGLKDVYWTVGLQTFPLEAFSEGYFTPGLLAGLLAGEKPASSKLPKVSQGFALPPRVRIVSPSGGSESEAEDIEVRVAAADQGGGVDEIRLYLNGKAVGDEGRDIRVAPAGSAGREKERAFKVSLVDGPNVLRAVALSRDRIESNPAEATVSYKGPRRKAVLHILAVGVNSYQNPGLDLNYARPDAEAVVDYLAKAGEALFADVRRRELFDAAATKPAILAQLAQLKAASESDVVVLYLAGHGTSVEDAWYFLPHEVVFPEREEEVKAKGLSSQELQAAVRSIGAQKVLILMDACRSGGALLAFAGRGIEDRKALAMLARSAGVHVVAASSRDQIAAEVKDLGHGVFTHTLLEGLKGAADGSPKDGMVTVRELLSYVESELPAVSRKYKAQPQYPVVDSRGMDFPLVPAR